MKRSSFLLGSARSTMITLLLGSVLQTPAQEQPKNAPAHKSSTGIRIPPTPQGDGVRFYLPQSWVAKFWKADSGVRPYVAQLPPHKLDTEQEFAPCLPPQRIAVGYVDATNVVHEKLAACVNFCEIRSQGKLFHDGLWGRLSRVDKIQVFLKEDRTLDVKFDLKELGGSEIRTRHLPLKGPREPLPADEAGSCADE